MKNEIAQYQLLHQQSIIYFKQGNLLEALSVCQQMTRLNVHSADAHNKLASVLMALDRTDEAAEAFKTVLKINPGLVSARYMLASLGEAEAPEKTPDSFVSETFDNYADRFDDELVGRLGYQAPQCLLSCVSRCINDKSKNWTFWIWGVERVCVVLRLRLKPACTLLKSG